ncbi:MAG TPA: GNAT family N-acetyltransferase [Variovorax sp.]|jgi:GNAT superfamily N-acetyltransferase
MLGAPEPLTPAHQLDDFDSGTPVLNHWLKRRARQNQASGASRTFVICEEGAVVGYYALASSAVMAQSAAARFRRNMPDPIPVVVLGRLAIAQTHQRRGLGRALFRDAGLRILQAAHTIGIRGLLVHAISAEARDFYLRLGLSPSPLDPLVLMVTLSDLRETMR